MRRILTILGALAMLVPLALTPLSAHASRPGAPGSATDATYFNDARFAAADPYVLFDKASGYYYAYSTDGADRGWHFAIYRSADLATWQKLPGGALPADDPNQWGNAWFWAPEVYHNPKTGLYYMFYAARSDANAQRWFGYADFEEPCKVGVAVSRSPAGPFHNITDEPIDYWPYDPNYHDVNLIMGPDQKKPPATLEQGQTAPLGTYIPFIDPDVYFDDTGKIYLYYSRNAYRNWVWDSDLHKYIEESNIYAVQLNTGWWDDPSGRTMPTVTASYVDANNKPGDRSPRREDGFVPVLDYAHDKQAWENADVNDYAKSGGTMKDRRWEEGSTTVKRYVDGRPVYYLTYSANNFQSPEYGVGYATASSPLGPWRKYAGNPILHQSAQVGMYSTGHGSVIASPDGSQLYYVHHGRPTPTTYRRLYTDRLRIDAAQPDPGGDPTMSIDQSTTDEPIPSGVAPYTIRATPHTISLRPGSSESVAWQVRSADRAALALDNPLNRVEATIDDPAVAELADLGSSTGRVVGRHAGHTWLRLSYQREKAAGGYQDVTDTNHGGNSQPVTVRVPVTVSR